MRPVRPKSCFSRPLRSTACCARTSPVPNNTCNCELDRGALNWNRRGEKWKDYDSYSTRDAGCENGPLGQLALVPVFDRGVSCCFPPRGRKGMRWRGSLPAQHGMRRKRRGICGRVVGGRAKRFGNQEREKTSEGRGQISLVNRRGNDLHL